MAPAPPRPSQDGGFPSFPTPLIPEAMGLHNPFFNTNVGANGLQQGVSFNLRVPRRRRAAAGVYAPYYDYSAVPAYSYYPVPVYAEPEAEPAPAPEPEPPAPTIFERRATVAPRPQTTRTEPAGAELPPQEERPQEPTVLVFKDGRQLEIGNYAILGDFVYVLSPEYRKIPLAALNLPATVKENQARGAEFRVPVRKGS
jgi:hypothetical protein